MTTVINVEDMAIYYRSRIKNYLQKRKTEEEPRNLQGKKFKSGDRKEDPPKKTRTSQPRNNFQKFFPLNTTWERVLMPVQDSRLFKYPRKIKVNPTNRKHYLYYNFHQNFDHKMDDYWVLQRKLSTRYKRTTLKTLWQLEGSIGRDTNHTRKAYDIGLEAC